MNRTQINFLKPIEPPNPNNKPPQKKRLIIYILLIFIFLMLASTLAKAIIKKHENTKIENGITLESKRVGLLQTVKNFLFKDEVVIGQDERINILLLGMGGEGHDGPYLTDTNILLSIKPLTNEVAMISVPRDMGAEIEGYGLTKINHANAAGENKYPRQGGEYARQVFEKTFDIDIPYYIRINFKAFKEMIDIVDGVNIYVKSAFVDNAYPANNYAYQTVIFKSGEQTMHGETALKFARSRHGNNGEGSDFSRARRQQQVINALKEKLLSSGTYTNPAKIKQIYDSLSENVSTNLNFGQIMYLSGLAKETNLNNVKNLTLDSGEDGYLYSTMSNGVYLLMPNSGDYGEISQAMQNIFNPDFEIKTEYITPAQTQIFPEAQIEIQNGTWQAGLASRAKQNLEEIGFVISSVGNTPERPVSTSLIYLINENSPTEITTALSQQLGLPTTTYLASSTTSSTIYSTSTININFEDNTEILIILGEDYLE